MPAGDGFQAGDLTLQSLNWHKFKTDFEALPLFGHGASNL
jgi:hypothetical protein